MRKAIKSIKKSKPLIEKLRTLPLNEKFEIKNSEHQAGVVRATVTKLRKEGLKLKATEKESIDSIIVTRIK